MPDWYRRNKRLAAKLEREFAQRIEDDKMAVVEPPIGPEGHDPIPDEEPVIVPDVVPTGQVSKDVCRHCLRPVVDIAGEWRHWDASIDVVQNPAFHFAELRVEEPVAWGRLNDERGSNLRVDPAKRWAS